MTGSRPVCSTCDPRPPATELPCDGSSRRDFLRVGGLTALSRLSSAVAPGRGGRQSRPGRSARAKSVILVYLGGGLSHHDSFDLKPDAPDEIRGKYQPIATNVPGLQVGELLPLHGAGRWTRSPWSAPARTTTTTTRRPPTGCCPAASARRSATTRRSAPSSPTRPASRGTLPPYVAVPRNPSFTWELGKSAFLGGRYESFKAGDPNAAELQGPGRRPGRGADRRSVERRGRRCSQAVDGLAQQGRGQRPDRDLRRVPAAGRRPWSCPSEARKRLRHRAGDRPAPRPLRPHHVRPELPAGPPAGRGAACGSSRSTTAAGTTTPRSSTSLDKQAARVRPRLLGPDRRPATTRGLLDDTLVVCMGEFGRTPKINKDAGRDHWGPAASLLFAGAGRQAAARARRDRQAGGVRDAAARWRPADVAYTIFDSLGIDPRKQLVTPGRPAGRDPRPGRVGEGAVLTLRPAGRLVGQVSNLSGQDEILSHRSAAWLAVLHAHSPRRSSSWRLPNRTGLANRRTSPRTRRPTPSTPSSSPPTRARRPSSHIRGVRLDTATEVRLGDPKSTGKVVGKGRKTPVSMQMSAEVVGDTEIDIEVTLPADVPGGVVPVSLVGPGGEGKPFNLLVNDDTPRVPEKEPNDGFKQAMPLTAPVIVEAIVQAAPGRGRVPTGREGRRQVPHRGPGPPVRVPGRLDAHPLRRRRADGHHRRARSPTGPTKPSGSPCRRTGRTSSRSSRPSTWAGRRTSTGWPSGGSRKTWRAPGGSLYNQGIVPPGAPACQLAQSLLLRSVEPL